MPAIEARDWLDEIDGIGKKTASVAAAVLLRQPLLPIDRHVDRVIAPRRPAPAEGRRSMRPTTWSSAMFEPDQMYEAHVNLIQHGREGLPRPATRARPMPASGSLPVRGPEGAVDGRTR